MSGKGRPTGAAPGPAGSGQAGRASGQDTADQAIRPGGVFPLRSCRMAAANLTTRRRRTIILATPLAELDGAALVIDCLTPDCAGERRVLVRYLAGVYGRQQTLAEALQRMRCTSCQGRAGAAWLVAGPGTERQRRAVRVALVGPDAVG